MMIRRVLFLSIALPLVAYAVTVERFSETPRRGDFVLQPAKIELSLHPGEQATKNIYVTNRLGEDALFSVSLESFESSSNPREGAVLKQKTPQNVRVWESAFKLSHGERATVPITISMPKEAEPGGLASPSQGGKFFAVVVAASSHRTPLGAARITSRVATLFFVRIMGAVREEGTLKDFSYHNGFFEILFENTGNVHLNPYGVVTVHRWWGRDDTIFVDPWFVLPHSSRIRSIASPTDLWWGRHTATLIQNRGYKNVLDTRDISFWVLPDRLEIIVFVFGSLLVIITTVAIMKRMKRYGARI